MAHTLFWISKKRERERERDKAIPQRLLRFLTKTLGTRTVRKRER